MIDLIIVVPTRERPHQLAPMMQAFEQTCRALTKVFFVVDGQDSCEPYHQEWQRLDIQPGSPFHLLMNYERRRLVGTLNFSMNLLAYNPALAVGYMGDDHRPRTVGWDEQYLEVLLKLNTGMVYGDDGHQGASLPTQIAMTVDIPQTLGYLVPPAINHMYCDNFWLDVGNGAGCITYLPDVHVEHQHPAIHPEGKWDQSYSVTNSAESYARDKAAYEAFVRDGGLAADIEKIRALRATTHRGNQ